MSKRTRLRFFAVVALFVALLLSLVSSLLPARAQGDDPSPTRLPIPAEELPAGQWTTYSKADGLGENNLRAIWGSDDGTVWVGTWGGGVSRFDGASWHTYTEADGLASNRILALAGDSLGNVWATGVILEVEGLDIRILGRGFSHFDPHTEGWTTYTTDDGLSQDLVRAIWPDGKGGVWLGTAEFKRLDVTLGHACPRAIYEGGGLTHFDPAAGRWATYTSTDGLIHDGVRALWTDADGVLWVGTDGGVSRFDPRTDEWTSYTTADGLGGDFIRSIWGDSLGNVWAGLEPVWDPGTRQATGGGISRFDPTTNRWATHTTDDGLGGNDVHKVWAYDEGGVGRVWVANDNVADGTCQEKGLSFWDGVRWHTVTAADGLPANGLGALWGDGHGTLWVGTLDKGASRFDGSHWTKTLTPLGGLTSDDVSAVYGDNRGTIWVGTQAGLDRFEAATGLWKSYTTADGLPSNAVGSLWVDAQGVPWAGTSYGVSRLDPYTDRWRTYTTADGLIDDEVRAIWADGAGAVWVATTTGAVSRFDPGQDRWESYTITDILGQAFIMDAWADEAGLIWLGTLPGGLVRFQPETGETQFFSLEELLSTYVTAVWGDGQGNIWAGTLEGLFVFDARTEQWVAKHTDDMGLLGSDILSLWLDDQGRMWVGGITGLTRYDPQTGDWTPLAQPATAEEMSLYIVQDIWNGDAGDVWLATEGGLRAFDPATDEWTLYTTGTQAGQRLTRDLRVEPDGDLWVATTGGGIGHWHAATGEWRAYDRLGPVQSEVSDLYRDQAGVLWAANGWGVARFDPTADGWTAYGMTEDLPAAGPTSLVVDKAGVVWAGSAVEGLMRYDPATGEGKTYPISEEADANWVAALQLDSSGAIWAGFRQKSGLGRFDPASETWMPYPVAEGAPGSSAFINTQVWSLYVDADDRVWVGTGDGLARYDPATGEWATYTSADGLAPGYVQAIWIDDNGTIWVGTDGSGLSRLDLSSYVPGERPRRWRRWKTFTPQNSGLSSGNIVALHGVPGSPIGDVLIGSDAWYGRYRPQPPRLTLTGTDADGVAFPCIAPDNIAPGAVVFDLFAVDFAHLADEIAYRWKIQAPDEPLPTAWHFLPNTRDEKHARVTVSAVEPGEHVFTVAAGNLDYDWSVPLVCRFTVRDVSPPAVNLLDPIALDFDGLNAAGDNPFAVAPPPYFWQRVRRFTWQVPFSDNVTPPEQLTYRYNLAGGGIVATGEYRPDQPPSVGLPPGRYLLNVSAIDAAGAESAAFTSTVSVPQPLAIQYLPYAGLGVLGLALLAVIARWWWRRRSKFRYLDVALLARRAEAEVGHQILLHTRGWSDAPHDLVDPSAFLPQGVLEQLSAPTGPIGPDADAALETLGTALYRALLSPEMRAYLAQQARRHHLRLRLSFVEGESTLDELPWEFLHGGDGLGFLSTNPRTAVVRFQPPPEAKRGPRLKTRLPLRILVMIADAPNLPLLNIDRERDTLVALGQAPGRRFQVDVETEASLARLQAGLEKGYDVVHFIGHGDVDEEGAFVYMLDARGGEALVTPHDLAQVIRGAATPPKLVLFNACNTAAAGGNELGMAPVLMRNAALPAVIGMQYPISDVAAARFTEGFYNALIHHGQVDYAVAQGRKAIAASEDTTPRDWACPVLYTQVADGIIFDRV